MEWLWCYLLTCKSHVLSRFSLKNFFFSLHNQTAYNAFSSWLLSSNITIIVYNAVFVWIMIILYQYRSSLLFFYNMHANITVFVVMNAIFSCKCISAVFDEFSGNMLCCIIFSGLSLERRNWKMQYSWLS